MKKRSGKTRVNIGKMQDGIIPSQPSAASASAWEELQAQRQSSQDHWDAAIAKLSPKQQDELLKKLEPKPGAPLIGEPGSGWEKSSRMIF